MKNAMPKGFLKTDKVIQMILGGAMICCLVFFPLVGIPFLILGVWQVISAIYLVSKINDEPRKLYLKVVVGWGIVVGTMYAFEYGGALWYAMLLLIPSVIAIWYFITTYADWKKTEEPIERLGEILDFNLDEL